jgi:hypothetical protein
MTRCTWALVISLAGCRAPGAGLQQPTPVATAPSAGCPTADNVYVASYLSHDEADAASAGHTGWVLPLYDAKAGGAGDPPEYSVIDPTTAGALGVPVGPGSVWLMMPNQPPCRATTGSYYAAGVEAPSPNVTYGVELTGCPAPPRDQQEEAEAIALVSEQAPTDCQLLTPQPVAARLGETDAQKHWQRPTKETPLPPAIAAIVPPRDCRSPGCETLWAFGQVDVAGRPVAWAGAVNWLTIPPNATPTSECDWKVDTFAGFFVATADGRAVKVTEGQDHPLLMTGVLADRSGVRALLAEGAGEYASYDLGGGGPRLAHHVVWLQLAPEAYAVDERIGPSCGGDEQPERSRPPAKP